MATASIFRVKPSPRCREGEPIAQPNYERYLVLLRTLGGAAGDYTRKDDLVQVPCDLVRVRASLIHGRGVYPASEPILAHTTIGSVYRINPEPDTWPGLQRVGKLGRYLNHSETPNTKPMVSSTSVAVVATKLISADCEITICYHALLVSVLDMIAIREALHV